MHIGVMPWRHHRALADDVCESWDLERALRHHHGTDAHLVAYHVPGQARMQRLRVDGPRPEGLVMESLWVDIDTVGHAPWSSHTAALDALDAALAIAGTAGGYVSRAGLRLVQPLDRRLDVDEGEAALRGWMHQLDARGIASVPGTTGIDWRCARWVWLYRLPHVMRDRARYVSPRVDLGRMVAIEPPAGGLVRRRQAGGPLPEVAWSADIPQSVAELADALGAAWPRGRGDRHAAAMALSGSLLRRGVRPEHLPAVVAHVVALSGDEEPADRVQAARDTARRYLARRPVLGLRALRDLAPGVAEVIAPLALEPLAPPPLDAGAPRAADAAAALLDSLRQRRPGVRLVAAACGVGKTHAVRMLAAERASMPHATPGPHVRPPPGSRTAVSVPTHDLARQIVADLRSAGVDSARVYGPLSVRDPASGELACRFAGSAQALAAGGQSVRRELCEGRGRPCQHRETCPARDGVDGDLGARVIVGPHALVAELAEAAGATGLLVIDEPPALTQHVVISADDIGEAMAHLDRFEPCYAAGMRPALSLVRHWVELGPVGESHALARCRELGEPAAELLDEAEAVLAERDVLRLVETCTDEPAPPLDAGTGWRCRIDPLLARHVGEASRVLGVLRRALLAPATTSARIEERGGRRVLALTTLDERLVGALRRDGETVVAAADVALHAPLYARLLGYEPPIERYSAADGAPMQRAIVETRATRSAWGTSGGVDVEAVLPALTRALGLVPRLVDGVPVRLCLVTYPGLEAALRLAMGLAPAPGAWRGSKARLEAAAAALRPLLEGRDVEVGHYGALRGLDHWRERDAVVTLGDPWPAVDAVERELGLVAGIVGDEARATRAAALAAAELEQAHGRLRAPYRTRPGLCVHVGRIVPAGWPADVRRLDVSPDVGEVSLADVQAAIDGCGGARAASRLLGVADRSVRRWASGEARPPPEIVAWVRSRAPS